MNFLPILIYMTSLSVCLKCDYRIAIVQTWPFIIDNGEIELLEKLINDKKYNFTVDLRNVIINPSNPLIKSINEVNKVVSNENPISIVTTDTCWNPLRSAISYGNHTIISINSDQECPKVVPSIIRSPNFMSNIHLLENVIKSLKLKYCSIFFDSSSDQHLIATLKSILNQTSICCKTINVQHLTDQQLYTEILSSEKNNLEIFRGTTLKKKLLKNNNFLFISDTNARRIINNVNKIEEEWMGTKGALNHNRWLFLRGGNVSNLLINILNAKKDVDNYAVLQIDTPKQTTLQYRLKRTVEEISALLLDNYYDDIHQDAFNQHQLDLRTFKRNLLTNYKNNEICDYFTLYYFPSNRQTYEKQQINCLSTQLDIFPNEKYGFNGKQLTVATLELAPFVIRKTNKKYTGVCIELLDELAQMLNFTYVLKIPADPQWGIKLQNGSWTGLVGMMERHEADLTLAALSVTEARSKVMDFSEPYYFEYTTSILKLPGINDNKWRVIIDPFRWRVWLCIILAVPFTGFFAWLLTNLSYKFLKDTPLDYSKTDAFRYWDKAIWYVFGAVLTQGGAYQPCSLSCRSVIAFWWCFSIVIVATYSGNLIAFLTVSKQELAFNSVEELLKLNNYKFGVLGGSLYEDYLKDTTTWPFTEYWEKALEFAKDDPSLLTSNYSQHIAKVKEGKYTFFADKTGLDYEVIKDCRLSTTPEKFLPYSYAIGLQKGSQYYRAFDDILVKLRSGGIMQYWHSKHWPKNLGCVDLNQPTSDPVTILDVQSAFYVLVGGLILGFIILFYEQIRFKFCSACKFKGKLSNDSKVAMNGKRANENGHDHNKRNGKKLDTIFLPD